ncbi:trichohyalin-like isoform X6 [Bufo bufo]|uniref:trichohyalin-like isoform X6 n=1 Tax=Bufo bufo TaxID=8384 RepID=UPI001ABEBC2A|nr:trichohyalin-like isoform X6 [Bufo bufo]
MDRDGDKMAESIINLTLEILLRLTGEEYTVVKKTSSEHCQAPVSEGRGGILSPISRPTPHIPIHEKVNREKVLELTNKIIELLTGEVPIRCQDVAVYFSMEESEYLEEYKDLYKNVMMEDHQPPIKEERTTPSPLLLQDERCPIPLLLQDGSEEHQSIPYDDQIDGNKLLNLDKDLTNIKAEDTYVRGDEQIIEDIPTDNHPESGERPILQRQILKVTSEMSKSNFKPEELEALITTMLEKGYDDLKCRLEKQAIIRREARRLWHLHGKVHSKDAMLKKWSDLKRHRMDLVKKVRDKNCPGVPLPKVRAKRSRKKKRKKKVVVEEKEMSEDEEQEEEQAGPSGHQAHSPLEADEVQEDDEEKKDEVVTTPHQEGLPLPKVCAKRSRKKKVVVVEEKEMSEDEEQEEEQTGPSGHQAHSPPEAHEVQEDDEEEDDKVVTTRRQEAHNNMIKKIKKVQREQRERMQNFRALQMQKIRELELQLSHQLTLMEEANQKALDELLQELKKKRHLP